MALDHVDLQHTATPDQERIGAPLAGTRSQSIQRLQVGLFGLAAMVLLVVLANIIMHNAEQNQATVVPQAASTVAAQQTPEAVTDPLADAGVVPDAPTGQPAQGHAPPPQP
jgi:hypothetical protein